MANPKQTLAETCMCCITRKSDCAQEAHTRRHVSPAHSFPCKSGVSHVLQGVTNGVDRLAELLCHK